MLPYYYNNQLKKYIVQFMYIFSGMQVKVGKSSTADERLIQVPIHFSQMDKVSAAIIAGNTTNKPVRVPVMSVDIMSLRQDPQTYAGLNQVHSETYLPEKAYFADGIKTISRLRPAPYVLDLDLAIWTSNTDQHFQMLEQILSIFNPSIQIQTSDGQFDWTKITTVALENIAMNNNYPLTTNNRVVLTNMTFTMPIFLSAPANVKDEFVRDILLRLSAVGSNFDMADMLNEFDDESLDYINIASADDVTDLANNPK